MENNNQNTKSEQEEKEKLTELLRILSSPSSVKDDAIYKNLMDQAKDLIKSGHIADERIRDFITKDSIT